MIKNVLDSELLTPDDECYSSELFNVSDNKIVRSEMCKKFELSGRNLE